MWQTRSHRIQKFTADGQFIPPAWGKFNAQGNPLDGNGNGEFNTPHGIVIDSSDNVYVADYANNRIQKFTSDGTFLIKFGDVDTNGNPADRSGDGELYFPFAVEVDTSGNVYVTDLNSRIQKFTANGQFICKWGVKGANPGQFYEPKALAIKSNDTFYVADTGNNRIQVFKKVINIANQKPSSSPAAGHIPVTLCGTLPRCAPTLLTVLLPSKGLIKTPFSI